MIKYILINLLSRITLIIWFCRRHFSKLEQSVIKDCKNLARKMMLESFAQVSLFVQPFSTFSANLKKNIVKIYKILT